MCDQESIRREKETGEAVCETFIQTLKTNGRCQYHEEITTKLSELKGEVKGQRKMFKFFMWTVGLFFSAMISLQAGTFYFLLRHLASGIKTALLG